MTSGKVKPLLFDSYIAMIRNSINTGMFRNFYARVDGKKSDVLRNGDLSCAIYVSAILVVFRLIKETHATVASTLRDMEEYGWKNIKRPRIGSIIMWEEKLFDSGEYHKHIGFYVGSDMAISNSSKSGMPKTHHWTYGSRNNKPKRKVVGIYWHNKLKN